MYLHLLTGILYLKFSSICYIFNSILTLFSLNIIYKTFPIISYLKKKPKLNEQHISVLIPIYNEEQNLKKLFNFLNLNNLDNIELIFINDSSTDRSLKILEAHKNNFNNMKVITCKKQNNVAGVLNYGFKYVSSDTDFIGVLNGDCVISYSFFNQVKNRLNNYDIKVLNVANCSQYPINSFVLKIADYDKSLRRMLFSYDNSSLNNGYFIDKQLLKDKNNWESITEDQNLALKLKNNFKITIFQDPDIHVYDSIPDTFLKFYKQQRRWIHGDILSRLNSYPNNLFDVIVNLYYFMPILTILSILFYNPPFFTAWLSEINIILCEAMLAYKSKNFKIKNLIFCFIFSFVKRFTLFLYYLDLTILFLTTGNNSIKW